MYDFLTLAIRETNPMETMSDFDVVAMDTQSKQIHSFSLKKDEIISQSGEIFWDIGFVTRVKDISKDSNGKLVPSGFVCKSDASDKLKTILEAKSTNPDMFFRNRSIVYAVVKVSKLSDIIVEKDNRNVLQSRITVNISRLPLYDNEKTLLNKDYRWIKFWEHIYNMDMVEEKKAQYLRLFNTKRKTMYLILYRHTFPSGKKWEWIAGMHWL